VVENFSSRVLAQYALDYDHLGQVGPDFIMVSMPGHGRSGPNSHFVSSGGPLMASLLWGSVDSSPNFRGKIAQPDYIVAGTQALTVIAILHREQRVTTRCVLTAHGTENGPDRFSPCPQDQHPI